MKITSVITVNIDNVPLTPQGRLVYKTIMKTGARSTGELMNHLDMDEAMIDLMLAHLLRYNLLEVRA